MTDYNRIDKKSRDIVCTMLSGLASITDIGDSHGNCVWDLSCIWNGKTTSIEVKDRSIESTRFGDIFAEDIKQECTKMNWNFQRSLAINVFTDNIIAIADLYDKDAKHKERYCPRTTLIEEDDHQYILKQTFTIPQRVRIKFYIQDGKLKFKRA